jgi:glycosyltransferase involved in cell wall biosynthesis
MTQAPLPRVLIVADNASALFGGEAILPLKYVALLHDRGIDVRLITHARNRDRLSETLPQMQDRISYSPDTAAHRWLWRIGARFPSAIRDHLFGNLMGLVTGWQQRRLARALVREGKVDLIHQPIPVSPAAPSLLHGMGVPVVIGPMNGGMRYPPGYEDFEGRASHLFVSLGRPMAGLLNWLIPGKRRAALLLVANTRTRAALPTHKPPVAIMPENGVDLSMFPGALDRPDPEGPLRLVFMGRLIALKAVDTTLRALARANERSAQPITLEILGDGPERPVLEALTHDLGLQELVTFHGFLPQTTCATHLERADALVLASLRECGGAVILEAMAMGLAVIASDWGGPRDYVTVETGLLVPPAPREGFADRLAEAMLTLAGNRAEARAMGRRGAAHVRAHYDWDRKIDTILAHYDRVLGR